MNEKDMKQSFKICRKYYMILSLLGLSLSYYSILVSEAKTKDNSYVALCDISERIRCSDVLTSSYSKGFGIIGSILGEQSPFYQSNGFYGLFFYLVTLVLSLYPGIIFAKILICMSISSIFISGYLGYILLYILEEFCVVCVSTYACNLGLLALSIWNLKIVKRLKEVAEAPDYSGFLDGRKKRV